jgi:hypothetical protein
MNPKHFPFLIALAFALSGCLGIGGDEPELPEENQPGAPGDDDPQEANGDDPQDEETDPAPSGPPTAQLTANNTSGDAPLTVTITLEGEHPDGLGLTWTLDLDDGNQEDGDTLPVEITYTYDQPGEYNLTLAVSDGFTTVDTSLKIDVQTPTGPTSEPNPAQSGSNALCLDYILLWTLNEDPLPGGIHFPLEELVEVEPGTGFMILSDDGTAEIDFFSADGFYVATHGDSGTVPNGAAYGIICVGMLGMGWPDLPFPAGEWTYQDGF